MKNKFAQHKYSILILKLLKSRGRDVRLRPYVAD